METVGSQSNSRRRPLKTLSNGQYAQRFGLSQGRVELAQNNLNLILTYGTINLSVAMQVMDQLTEGPGRDVGPRLIERAFQYFVGVELPNFARITEVKGIGPKMSLKMARELSKHRTDFVAEHLELSDAILNPLDSEFIEVLEDSHEIYEIEDDEWMLAWADVEESILDIDEEEPQDFEWFISDNDGPENEDKPLQGEALLKALQDAIYNQLQTSEIVKILDQAKESERVAAFVKAYNTKYDMAPGTTLGKDRFSNYALLQLAKFYPKIYIAITKKEPPNPVATFKNYLYGTDRTVVHLAHFQYLLQQFDIKPQAFTKIFTAFLKSKTVSASRKQTFANFAQKLGDKYADIKKLAQDFIKVRERTIQLLSGEIFKVPASKVIYYEDDPSLVLHDPNDWILREKMTLVGEIGSAHIQHPQWGKMVDEGEVVRAHGAALTIMNLGRPEVNVYLFSNQFWVAKRTQAISDAQSANLHPKHYARVYAIFKNLNATNAYARTSKWRGAIRSVNKHLSFQHKALLDKLKIALKYAWLHHASGRAAPWDKITAGAIAQFAVFFTLGMLIGSAFGWVLALFFGPTKVKRLIKAFKTFYHQCDKASSTVELQKVGERIAEFLNMKAFDTLLSFFAGKAAGTLMKKPPRPVSKNRDVALINKTRKSLSSAGKKQLDKMVRTGLGVKATARYIRRHQKNGVNIDKLMKARAKHPFRNLRGGRPRLGLNQQQREKLAEQLALRRRGITGKNDAGIRKSMEQVAPQCGNHMILAVSTRPLKKGIPKGMEYKAKTCRGIDLIIGRHKGLTRKDIGRLVCYKPRLPSKAQMEIYRKYNPKLYKRIIDLHIRRAKEYHNKKEFLHPDDRMYVIDRKGRVKNAKTGEFIVSDNDVLALGFPNCKNPNMEQLLVESLKENDTDVLHGVLSYWPDRWDFSPNNRTVFMKQWGSILGKGEPIIIYEYNNGTIRTTLGTSMNAFLEYVFPD